MEHLLRACCRRECAVTPDEIKAFHKQRRIRFETAKAILAGPKFPSLGGCGCRLIDKKTGVTVMHSASNVGGNVRFAGAASCGSVWVCPHCAPSVTEGRALEIQRAVDAWMQPVGSTMCRMMKWKSNDVAMLTLTFSHKSHQPLADLMHSMKEAQADLRASAGWKNAIEDLSCIGVIRALEITWGQKNGWHPHVHFVLFLKDGVDQSSVTARLAQFEEDVFPAWQSVCVANGLGAPSRLRGINIVHGESVSEKLAAYVQKFGREPKGQWGIERELAKNHTKTTKSSEDGSERYHPFGLLDAFKKTGDDRFRRLFLEYALAFKGQRQLVWQRGLKDRLSTVGFVRDERTDSQLAQAPAIEETQVSTIDRQDWFALCRFGLVESLRTALLAIPSHATVRHFVTKARMLYDERLRSFQARMHPPCVA